MSFSNLPGRNVQLNAALIDPLMQQVILVQACMSAAIYSVITALLFDLEERLASALFVVNTVACLVFVVPVLFWITSSLKNLLSSALVPD